MVAKPIRLFVGQVTRHRLIAPSKTGGINKVLILVASCQDSSYILHPCTPFNITNNRNCTCWTERSTRSIGGLMTRWNLVQTVIGFA